MTHTHLDDEALSAVLDGDAPEPDTAHVGACASCAARLDALERAVRAVATPVVPPPGAADAAVMAAVRAAAAPVEHARPRRQILVPILAAAAVLMALLIAVPLLGDGDDRGRQTAAGRDDALESAAGAPVDLGALDAASLPQSVAARLDPTAAMRAPAPAAAEDDEAAGDTFASEGAAGGSAPTAAADCTRAPGRDPSTVALSATGTWEGRPVLVIAYHEEGGDVTAYVIDPADDCRIVHFARFPPKS